MIYFGLLATKLTALLSNLHRWSSTHLFIQSNDSRNHLQFAYEKTSAFSWPFLAGSWRLSEDDCTTDAACGPTKLSEWTELMPARRDLEPRCASTSQQRCRRLSRDVSKAALGLKLLACPLRGLWDNRTRRGGRWVHIERQRGQVT